jgi:predicted RNA-binding protein Jag
MRHTTPIQEIPGLAIKWCALLGLAVEAEFEPSGDELLFPNRLVISGQDASHLLSGRAQALDALQFLLHETQGERDDSRLVYLDVQSARLYRMRELLAMTKIAAQKARDTGSYVFTSLTSKERRWVHLTIGKEDDLDTSSEGHGAVKSLKVFRRMLP